MLSWIFKKTGSPVATPTAPSKVKEAEVTEAVQDDQPRPPRVATAVWITKLQGARGDDAALMALAKDAPSIEIKLAAVEALEGEEALKLAEREFRSHDRRVYRVAKLRREALLAQRIAREKAAQLIQTATDLIWESTIPVNRLVELDRAWQSLDAKLLTESQQSDFAVLSSQLTVVTRKRGEQEQLLNRWTESVKHALFQLNSTCREVAAGAKEHADLSAARHAVHQILGDTVPEGHSSAMLAELQAALMTSTHIEAHLALLDRLHSPAPGRATASGLAQGDTTESTGRVAVNAGDASDMISDPARRWKALPAVADAQAARNLERRFDQWARTQSDARRAQQAKKRQDVNDAKLEIKQEHRMALESVLQLAEASLADGRLANTNQHLVAIDEALETGCATEVQNARIQALQAEYARLKGWQHWGGGRVRDDLVLEAEALAKSASLTDELRAGKLPVKQLAEAIDALRKRWKELDRLGGATSRALWQRFNEALKTAYQPVAGHLAQLDATRQANLEARHLLVAALEAIPLVQEAGDSQTNHTDWRDVARAIDHFHMEWRKLGPVEHTVPHNARAALTTRMQATLARLEDPLQDIRRAAQVVRERMIARAKSISADAGSGAQSREGAAQIRELQAEWQQHARSLPLTRHVENALWTEFKAATDAFFAQREADFNARDAELQANHAKREELIARLEELKADAEGSVFKRVLAEVDLQWRDSGESPRRDAANLDARYRAARAQVQKFLADHAQRKWHTTCDTLLTKLSLCEAVEDCAEATSAAQDNEDDKARWAAQLPLPQPWERALAQRWARSNASLESRSNQDAGALDSNALDTLLLQLEVALDMASPVEFQEARRDLKLRTMKAALEGKPGRPLANSSVEELMGLALGRSPSCALQRERLRRLIAALRVEGEPARR